MLRVGTLVWQRRCRGGWLGCERCASVCVWAGGLLLVFWEFSVLIEVGCEVLVGLCVSEVLCLKGQYMDIQGAGDGMLEYK